MFENEGFSSWFKETFQKEDCLNNVVFTRKFLLDAWNNGYNKANEWHYVKDGDLPKHEVNVLVLFNKQCVDIAHYNYDYKEWHFTDSIVRDVIAWKEIVLPELKESE